MVAGEWEGWEGVTQGKESSSLSTHFPANGADDELTKQLTFQLDDKEVNGMDFNSFTNDNMCFTEIIGCFVKIYNIMSD